MDLSKILLSKHRGWVNVIRFRSTSVSFGSMYFFFFLFQILDVRALENLSENLSVRFLNQHSCNKGLKAKISCFLTCFFLFNRSEAGMF